MQIGIFAKTFTRSTLREILCAVREQGLRSVQFNMSCAGLASMPDRIDLDVADTVRQESKRQGITLAAISGTFNMIDPDVQKRRTGLRRLRVLASACKSMGTQVITLCSGSRDPDSMWTRHPDNDSLEAWADLRSSMTEALKIAEGYQVILAIEPEVSNVVDSAHKARTLLNEMQSSHLKVVMDGANLFHAGELPKMRQILDDAFQLLGDEIILAHAKDLSADGAAGQEAAGTGRLDYDHYIYLLHAVGFNGSLILHGLRESQVPTSVAFLEEKLSQSETQAIF